jgi:predicted GNAT family acetyltransferase
MNILLSESQLQNIFEFSGEYINLPVDKDVALELWEQDNKLELDSIVIPKNLRGQGMGTKVMNVICDYSDSVNKPLFLTPGTTYGGSSFARLERFYKRFGFVKNKNSRDLSIHYMVRYPKSS